MKTLSNEVLSIIGRLEQSLTTTKENLDVLQQQPDTDSDSAKTLSVKFLFLSLLS